MKQASKKQKLERYLKEQDGWVSMRQLRYIFGGGTTIRKYLQTFMYQGRVDRRGSTIDRQVRWIQEE